MTITLRTTGCALALLVLVGAGCLRDEPLTGKPTPIIISYHFQAAAGIPNT